jgi:hypothetical protein
VKKLSLLILGMAFLTYGAAFASWSAASSGDQYISAEGGNSVAYSPVLAKGPQGQLYCAWAQKSGSSAIEIYFSESTDNGQTWSGSSGDVQISPFNNESVWDASIFGDRRFDIGADSQNRIFVVWPEKYIQADFDNSIEIILVYSTDGGNSWVHSDLNYPISDTLTTSIANRPVIAVDHSDNLHVCWSQTNTVTNKTDVFYTRSTDHGITWSSERAISYPDSNAFLANIAIGADNKIHVVWKEKNDANWNINYGVSTDGGLTFSSETADRIVSNSFGTTSYGYPRIDIGSTGNIFGIYTFNDTAYFFGSTNQGTTWNTVRIFTRTAPYLYPLDIAVASNGYIIAIVDDQYFGSSNSRGLFALYSSNNGQNWTSSLDPITYNDGGVYDRAYIPDIEITSGDTLHVTYYTNYQSSSNSYQEIGYSRNDNFLSGLAGTLAGHVYEQDGTTPISGITVDVYDSTSFIATCTTNAAGYYRFFLPPLTYSAHFSKYAYHDSTIGNLVVTMGNTTTLNVNLRQVIPGTIGGIVYEQSGLVGQAGVTITAYDSLGILRGTANTDWDGSYSLLMQPSRYTLNYTKTNFRDTTISGLILAEAGSVNQNVNLTWSILSDDIAATSLNEPAVYMLIGESYNPIVTVANFGYLAQTFDLNLKIYYTGTTLVYDQTITGINQPLLDSSQQIFATLFTPANAGIYTYQAAISNTGDMNSLNDTIRVDITAFTHQGQGGPDAFGYKFKDNTVAGGPTYNWIDVSTTGIEIASNLDYFCVGIDLGFSFPFYGVNYDSLSVNSHGEIHENSPLNWSRDNYCPLPGPGTPTVPFIAIFWDWMIVQQDIEQGIWYQYFDMPSNDYTVIQWKVSRDDTPNRHDSLEHEIILYEDGTILFQYKHVTDLPNGRGENATVGLESETLSSGITYLCDNDNPANRLTDGLAIKWYINETPQCEYMIGDINSDNQRLGGDVTFGVRYFKGLGSVPPDSCFMDSTGSYLYVAGDVNGNCEFRGSDITRLVAYFKGMAVISNCHFFPTTLPPLKIKR